MTGLGLVIGMGEETSGENWMGDGTQMVPGELVGTNGLRKLEGGLEKSGLLEPVVLAGTIDP